MFKFFYKIIEVKRAIASHLINNIDPHTEAEAKLTNHSFFNQWYLYIFLELYLTTFAYVFCLHIVSSIDIIVVGQFVIPTGLHTYFSLKCKRTYFFNVYSYLRLSI